MQLEKYEQRERNQVSDSTLRSRMSALKKFNDFRENKREEPTVEDVENWIDHLIELHEKDAIKASTIRQYFKAVKYYFEKVLNKQDNLEHIKRWLPDQDVDHGAYLTEQEWANLRNAIYNIRDKAIVEIMYHYARRPGEVILLNREDIDLEEGTIRFNILKKKKDDRGDPLPWLKLYRDGEVYKEHKVFRATFELLPEIEQMITKVIDFGGDAEETIEYDGEKITVHPLFSATNPRISYSSVWRMIKNASERAGIEKNITPKSWRHSRATHLNWAGHSPEQIADKQLVHDPETDVIGAYVHPRDEDDVREVMSTDKEEE